MVCFYVAVFLLLDKFEFKDFRKLLPGISNDIQDDAFQATAKKKKKKKGHISGTS